MTNSKGWRPVDNCPGLVVWAAPAGVVMVENIEPGGLSPADARAVAKALLEAADYAEGETND